MYADETIWCTQKAMAALFDVGVPAISKHLANVFETGELKEEANISKMETVQQEGNREVKRTVVMYKLDAIIAVGYRVNSIRATQFRQWATSVLRQYAIRGYVLDKKDVVTYTVAPFAGRGLKLLLADKVGAGLLSPQENG